MNRRQLLKALAAGAVVTASGLWFPGQKLISIPKTIHVSGEASGIITTGNYPKALWPGIERWFYDTHYKEMVREKIRYEEFYKVASSL